MTDDNLNLMYDLAANRLADYEHKSGCPATPERQEAEVVRKPAGRGLVKTGVSSTGEPIYEEMQAPGEIVVRARCCDCGEQRLLPTRPDTRNGGADDGDD
jgi:hypothetical protein